MSQKCFLDTFTTSHNIDLSGKTTSWEHQNLLTILTNTDFYDNISVIKYFSNSTDRLSEVSTYSRTLPQTLITLVTSYLLLMPSQVCV